MGLRPAWSKLFFPYNPYTPTKAVYAAGPAVAPTSAAPAAAAATPSTTTPTAPQEDQTDGQTKLPVIATTMSDFTTAARVGQVWQSGTGALLHLTPDFKFTAQDNNKIVFEGNQWRTADNAQLAPAQSNTLQATDFPLTLRPDMQAVVAQAGLRFGFADMLSRLEEEERASDPWTDHDSFGTCWFNEIPVSWWVDGGEDYNLGDDEEMYQEVFNLLERGEIHGTLIIFDALNNTKLVGEWYTGDFRPEATAGLKFADMINVPDPTALVEASASDGWVVVDVEHTGEGHQGDYDPEDPLDEPLLRISVNCWVVDDDIADAMFPDEVDEDHKELEQLDSVCTQISARITQDEVQHVADVALRFVANEVHSQSSIREKMSQMSYWNTDAFTGHTRTRRTADMVNVPDPSDHNVSVHGRIDIEGRDVEWHMDGVPGYDIVDDDASYNHVQYMINEGYVEGELVYDDNLEPSTSGRGWWELVRPQRVPRGGRRTAAVPAHQGEYTWEAFRRAVRPGQIWQTSNSLIRVDRLLNNAQIRRDSRFIRFRGAWTGNGPRAVQALLPQKDTGQFLTSTGPWAVSRRFAPFLLIRDSVWPSDPLERDPMDSLVEPPAANERPEPSITFVPEDRPLTTGESPVALSPTLASLRLEADMINVPDAFPLGEAYTELLSWLHNHRHGSLLRPAFNIKVQRVDIPDVVRQRRSEAEVQSIFEAFTREYIHDFVMDMRDKYMWIDTMYTDGRSGGWLETSLNMQELPEIQIVLEAYGDSWSAKHFFDEWLTGVEMEEQLDADGQPDTDYAPEQLTAAQDAEQLKLVQIIRWFLSQLEALETDVQEAKQRYVQTLESEEFWGTENVV